MKLQEYKRKRNFKKTAEPAGKVGPATSHLYLIQKHAATRLHYDFRLAMGGVLKSWAVPKGPSLNPADKRLAVHVEDHPIDYGSFEGTIPKGEYGGGTVMMWDRGEWEPVGDAEKAYAKGHLTFRLKGQRLKGTWSLIRMGGRASEDGKNWLLVKDKDDIADTDESLVDKFTTSVITRRSMDEIASRSDNVWRSGKKKPVHPISSASTLSGAKKAPFPEEFSPQLATLADDVPKGDQWIHELKYDGYRLLAFIRKGKVRFFTRNQLDWTDRFSPLVHGVEKLSVEDAILDGEVVVQKEDGTTDFQALQNALKTGEKDRLAYYVFDIPYCDGHDLMQVPLLERKKLLKHILVPDDVPAMAGLIRFSDHIEGEGVAVFKNACSYALEGIVSKNVDSSYQQRRSTDWLKVKCSQRQEFVVGGFTAPKGGRQHFGSLLLGTYGQNGELIYAGHVGTGFTDTSLTSMYKALNKRRQKNSPFHGTLATEIRRNVVWVKPDMVVEVHFAGWTSDKILRHPSFEGVREDKKAREVILEAPKQISKPAKKSSSTDDTVAGVKLSHPDKVLYPDQGITKRDLCSYYERVGKWMLPHIKGRPISLVRCPEGEGKPCFFQKHFKDDAPKSIRGIDIKEKDGKDTYILIDNVEGLVSMVQLGVLEFHPWGATERDIEKPDRLVFDLDPDVGVKIPDLVAGARLVRDKLADLGLMSFVKTTGGKGLHVVVPVQPKAEWDAVKAFTARIANEIVAQHPKHYVATMSKAHRTGKIFIDYFRNGRGATSVAAYSSRARKGATVSTPLSWDELTPSIDLAKYTIETVPERLEAHSEIWRGFFEVKQSLKLK